MIAPILPKNMNFLATPQRGLSFGLWARGFVGEAGGAGGGWRLEAGLWALGSGLEAGGWALGSGLWAGSWDWDLRLGAG